MCVCVLNIDLHFIFSLRDDISINPKISQAAVHPLLSLERFGDEILSCTQGPQINRLLQYLVEYITFYTTITTVTSRVSTLYRYKNC